MRVEQTIRAKLLDALAPERLVIVDDSAGHAGHAGARPGGETHFRVEIISDRFEGLSRLERQRLVHRVLAEELTRRIHALELQTLTPAEAAARAP